MTRSVSICARSKQEGPVVVQHRSVQLLRKRPRGMKLDSPLFLSELQRLEQMNLFARTDDVCSKSVVGVDEVGAGALAGPVVSCAVVLPSSPLFEGLNDSKKLTAARRREISGSILATSGVVVGYGEISSGDVDKLGILEARLLAMRLAVSEVLSKSRNKLELLLVDGDRLLEECPIPLESQQCIVGGDGKCAAIAAASIIAKVSRDHQMAEAGKTWPVYGFERHAGYGTRAHMEALMLHGPCDLHRLSYKPVREAYYAKARQIDTDAASE